MMSTRGRHGPADAHTPLRPQKNSCTAGLLRPSRTFPEHLLCAGEASALKKHTYKKLNAYLYTVLRAVAEQSSGEREHRGQYMKRGNLGGVSGGVLVSSPLTRDQSWLTPENAGLECRRSSWGSASQAQSCSRVSVHAHTKVTGPVGRGAPEDSLKTG